MNYFEDELKKEGYKEYVSLLFQKTHYEKSYFKRIYDGEKELASIHFHLLEVPCKPVMRYFHEVVVYLKLNGVQVEMHLKENLENKMSINEVEAYVLNILGE